MEFEWIILQIINTISLVINEIFLQEKKYIFRNTRIGLNVVLIGRN